MNDARFLNQSFELPAGPPAPTRLMARFIAEIQLAAMTAALDVIETDGERSVDLDRAVILFVVLRANLGRSLSGNSLGEANSISINAMAASLGRPFETVRRHVNALIAAGICCKCRRGICISDDVAAGSAMEQMTRRLHDSMVLLIDYAARHGISMPPRRTDLSYDRNATVVAALDLMLSAFEFTAPYYGDWMEMRIVNAFMAANARPITFDPALAQLYSTSSTVPPDHLRRPLSVANLSRVMRVPYSTAQRYVTRAIKDGKLRRAQGGILVTQQLLADPAVSVVGPAAMARATRAFGRLVQGGFPFDDPPSCYLDGPPDLLDFGHGVPRLS